MISDKLYELAFAYKKTKLWNFLWDMEVFAVKLSDGRIGYISIMGAAGEHCALGLYIGEEGFNSFRTVAKADRLMMSYLQFQEHMLRQNCLQCAFEGRDELSEEEREEAKKYARSHGIRISGRNAYPHFVKYQANCYPWHLQTDQEQEDLCEALAAAIEMARLLEGKMSYELGLERINDETIEVPMLELQNGVYVLKKAKLPEDKPVKWPEPIACNDIRIAKLKKEKKVGVWECEIIRFPNPIQNDPEETPYFPVALLAVEASANYILPVSPVTHYEENPEELLNLFMDAFLLEHICPMEIKVRDERTYAFAKAFCDRLNIAISMEEELSALDDAEYDFLEHFGRSEETDEEEIIRIVNEILELDDEQLHELPAGMIEQLKELVQQGILPDDVEDKLNQRFHFQDTGKSKIKKLNAASTETESRQSYVISVSLGTGCYRHIQISCGSTLFKLHSAILEAFEFMDDHAHAFFMDNVKWSERNCYYAEGIEQYYRTTKKYTLEQAGLHKGMQFKYVFDFGDEWTFQCKVLRVAEEVTAKPKVIRSKGEAPSQYSDWEDE